MQLSNETDGGTRFNVHQTRYAGQGGHTGRAAWFRDSENDILCVDQAESTPS